MALCNGMGTSCCCGPCYKKATCTQVGGVLACKCVPKKICLFLWTTEAGCGCGTVSSYEAAASSQATYDCVLGGWAGSLSCDGTGIDVEVGFVRGDDGELYIYLESACLGYTGDYRLTLPLGGAGHDTATRITNCASLGFDFDVDLSGCVYGCGTARITVEIDDMVCRDFDRYVPTALACDSFTRACIEYETYDGTVYRDTVCAAYNAWAVTLNGVDISVSQTTAPHVLTLSISQGTPADSTQTPECPAMYAEWAISDGATVRIFGDRRAGCVDCRCVCESLCVSRYPSGNSGTAYRELLTWNAYSEAWVGETLTITPICDECTGGTSFQLTDEAGTVTFSNQGTCPDVAVEALARTIGSVDYHYYIECKKCQDCVLASVITDCSSCPDGIPATLTATVENPSSGCPCANGLTVTLNYNYHPVNPAWIGTFASGCLSGFYLRLECSIGDCNGLGEACRNFRLTEECSGVSVCASTGCACDPFELLFTALGDSCANCDDPATAGFSIRVTE